MSKHTLMNAEIYDAFMAAGADEEKARAAAQSVAHYDNRLDSIERQIIRLSGHVILVQWMLGFSLVISGGILWQVMKLIGTSS
ncbi:MAG: integrase [Gammaproteobacteria bacterium]